MRLNTHLHILLCISSRLNAKNQQILCVYPVTGRRGCPQELIHFSLKCTTKLELVRPQKLSWYFFLTHLVYFIFNNRYQPNFRHFDELKVFCATFHSFYQFHRLITDCEIIALKMTTERKLILRKVQYSNIFQKS